MYICVCGSVQCTYVCGLVQCGLVQCMYNIVCMYVG